MSVCVAHAWDWGVEPTFFDIAQGIDDDTLCAFDLDDLGGAIGGARVINEPSDATLLGGVDDGVLIDTEEVAASDTALHIFLLPHVCHLLSNNLSNVLDDHVVCRDVLHGVQAPVVNCRAREPDGLLSLLQLVESHDICVTGKYLLLVVQLLHETTVVDTVFAGRRGGLGYIGGSSLGWRSHNRGVGALSGNGQAVRKVLRLLGLGNLAISFCPGATTRVGTVEAFNLLHSVDDTYHQLDHSCALQTI
jgi:hypothetical protein